MMPLVDRRLIHGHNHGSYFNGLKTKILPLSISNCDERAEEFRTLVIENSRIVAIVLQIFLSIKILMVIDFLRYSKLTLLPSTYCQ